MKKLSAYTFLDTLALAVSTPGHLNEVGLLPDFDPEKEDAEADLNYLMSIALDKITFLPFGYLMDKFRYEIVENPRKLLKILRNSRK